jgi:hypothetical protein
MPTQSAYKSYLYDNELGFDTKYNVKDLVQECHAYNSKANKWKLFPLKDGAFGYDNIIVCLYYIFKKIKTFEKLNSIDIEKMSDYIHRAWIKNYVYWRDNEPYRTGEYIKSAKPLNDENRNKLAITKYIDLPEEEKEKDRIIARFIKQKFCNKN